MYCTPASLQPFGLLATRNDTPYPDIHEEVPPILRAAILSQTCLGWDQLFYGCITHHLETAIDQLHPHLAVSGCQIVTQLLKITWMYVLAIWSKCNQHLHHNAGHLSLPDYQQAIKMIYELGSQLPPAAQEALFQ